MAENVILKLPLIADGTVNAKRFCVRTASGTLDECDSSGEWADGVSDGALGTSVSTGTPVTLQVGGRVEVECSGTVTAGEQVQTDASGKAITLASGKALGEALTTATNGVVDIMLYAKAFEAFRDITDSTTGTAANTLAAGVGKYILTIPIHSLATVADGDVLTTMAIPHKFKILSFDAYVTNEVTTAAKATSLNLEIGTTNVTGGVVALTSANCATLGAKVAGSAITADNTGAADATISIEASSTTAFVEGGVVAVIAIQNMDTADAFATLATDLISAGVWR